MPTAKCVLVRDDGTGKATFVMCPMTGGSEKKYTASQEKFRGLRDIGVCYNAPFIFCSSRTGQREKSAFDHINTDWKIHDEGSINGLFRRRHGPYG